MNVDYYIAAAAEAVAHALNAAQRDGDPRGDKLTRIARETDALMDMSAPTVSVVRGANVEAA